MGSLIGMVGLSLISIGSLLLLIFLAIGTILGAVVTIRSLGCVIKSLSSGKTFGVCMKDNCLLLRGI